jgi:hypothetical protein
VFVPSTTGWLHNCRRKRSFPEAVYLWWRSCIIYFTLYWTSEHAYAFLQVNRRCRWNNRVVECKDRSLKGVWNTLPLSVNALKSYFRCALRNPGKRCLLVLSKAVRCLDALRHFPPHLWLLKFQPQRGVTDTSMWLKWGMNLPHLQCILLLQWKQEAVFIQCAGETLECR